jgi:hypothetical protein
MDSAIGRAGGSVQVTAGGGVEVSPAAGQFVRFAPAAIAADNVTDDRNAIQALLDRATNPSDATAPQRVELPQGGILLGDAIHLGYGGTFPYMTAVLIGQGDNYVGDGPSFKGTRLRVTFLDRPAVVVQGGRLSRIQSLGIRGPNRDHVWSPTAPLFGTGATVDVSDKMAWRNAALAASPNSYGRYAPLAGVAVDPYTGSRPTPSYPNVIYPTSEGPNSRQWDKAPSGQTTLEDVTIVGFEVGVVTMPSGGDGNGDFLSLWRCSLQNNVHAVSVTHTQGRINTFYYCNFGRNHTVLTTNTHGKQQGGVTFVFDACAFGWNVQLLSVDTAYSGAVSFNGCYGEQVWRIGSLGGFTQNNQSVAFNDCNFNFSDNGPKLGLPATLATGSGNAGVVFRGGLHTLPGVSVFDCPLEVQDTVFANVWIDQLRNKATLDQRKAQQVSGGILVRPNTIPLNYTRVKARTQYFWDDIDAGGPLPFGGSFVAGGRKRPIPWFVSEVLSGFGALPWGPHPRPVPVVRLYDKAAINGIGGFAGLNASTGVGTIKLPETILDVQKGDLLIDDKTLTVWLVTAVTVVGGKPFPTRSDCTVVPLNNLKDLDTTPVLRDGTNLTASGNIYVLRSGVYTTTYPLFGDFTAGRNVIDNVSRGDGHAGFLASELGHNDFLLLGYMAQGGGAYGHVGPRCRVAAVSNTGGTTEGGRITMDRAATRSGSRVPLGYFLRNDN